MSGTNKTQTLRPSYEEGELRDKSIEALQDPSFTAEAMGATVKRAVPAKKDGPPKGAASP
ncbi:MAG: hypothetical protein AAB037_05150 [Chloroflexota bacterium]